MIHKVELYENKNVPDVCPFCGQRIDRRNPDQVEHHRYAPHMVYGLGKKKAKRRWQAVP